MGKVPRMTVPTMAYPAITMTDTYANPGDERGKKIGVPKSLVGSGERDIFFFHGLGSLHYQCPSPCTPFSLTAYCGCVPYSGKRCLTFPVDGAS